MQRWTFSLGIGLFLLAVSAYGSRADAVAGLAELTGTPSINDGRLCATGSVTTATHFFVLLGAGLLTGLSHCAGMCGPLLSAFTLRRRAVTPDISTALVLYQSGRLTTYMWLGAIAGALGSAFAALVRDWQGAFSIALGVAAVLLGLRLLGLLPAWSGRVTVVPLRRLSRWMQHRMTSTHPAAPFALGLANGLLPCGPLYAMLLLAALSGTPWQGASLMFVFGLGTLPAMLGFAFAAAFLGFRLRQHLYRMAAGLVVLVGLQLTLRGLALHGQLPHLSIGGVMLW